MVVKVNPSEYVRQPREHGGNIDGPQLQHEHYPGFGSVRWECEQ